jgi:hypothetical protein
MALNTDIHAMEADSFWPALLSKNRRQRPLLKRSWLQHPNPAITPASDDAANDVDAVASRIAAAV